MKDFDFVYGDEKVSNREMFLIVPSMLMAVGILTLPRDIVEIVSFVDGWMSIAISGILACFFVGVVSKLAARFPGESFYEYAEKIVFKPIAWLLTFLFMVHFAAFTCYEARAIATLSKQYIFDRTPVEIISLIFILLIAYAVSGSRAAILRLNMMFFPIVLFILLMVLVFNITLIELSELKPFFEANWLNVLNGVQVSAFSFLGFEILLFYISLVKKDDSKKVKNFTILGTMVITFIYIIVFFVAVAVLSVEGTKNVLYPTVELAKEVNVPGGIIERIDPIFFTVWIMTIFNTAAMALDVFVMAFQSLFNNVKKKTILFVSLPIFYLISMLPQDRIQLGMMGDYIGYSGLLLACFIPFVLLIIAQIRGVKGA